MKNWFWLDSFSHQLISSNDLSNMILDHNITGLTSNPTILANAIKNDNYYQQVITSLTKFAPQIKYEKLVFPDIIKACQLFLPIYESSNYQTGFVSLELDPKYTFDIDSSISSAKQIWKYINQPNLMIKIPASAEGIIVAQELLMLGMNINLTLIFNIEQLLSFWQAYITAIKYRDQHSLPLSVRAVVSFFISRLDAVADNFLPHDLQGKTAVNLALTAYQHYKNIYSLDNDLWQYLHTKKAIPPHLLWASVGVKNSKYDQDKYLKELYLTDTIFTLPNNLVGNKPQDYIDNDNLNRANGIIQAIDDNLQQQNKSIQIFTKELFDQAVMSFQKSFKELMALL